MSTARQTPALPGATFSFWLTELSEFETCQVRLTPMRGATQAFNEDPSPTIYLGSRIIDGPNPVWPE